VVQRLSLLDRLLPLWIFAATGLSLQGSAPHLFLTVFRATSRHRHGALRLAPRCSLFPSFVAIARGTSHAGLLMGANGLEKPLPGMDLVRFRLRFPHPLRSATRSGAALLNSRGQRTWVPVQHWLRACEKCLRLGGERPARQPWTVARRQCRHKARCRFMMSLKPTSGLGSSQSLNGLDQPFFAREAGR